MTAARTWVDGVPGDAVPADDRGLAFGDGLFETMTVHGGLVRFLDRHLARLVHGCARLSIPSPDVDALRAQVGTAAAGVDRAVVKLVVTRGSSSRGYDLPAEVTPRCIVSLNPMPAIDPARYRRGIDLGVCRTRLGRCRRVAGLKSLNRLEQVLGRDEVTRRGLDEAVMLDDADAVIEATAANVFVVGARGVVTPDLSECGVRGVMREVVIDTLDQLSVECRVMRVSLSDLADAHEIWLTNAVFGVTPVARFAGRDIAGMAMAARVSRALGNEGVVACG